MDKVYYSQYEEYPIFEPAEGGYYYSGRGVSAYSECDSFEDAFEEFVSDIDTYKQDGYTVNYNDTDLEKAKKDFETNGRIRVATYSSNYVGDGIFIQIEKELGESESEKQVYENTKPEHESQVLTERATMAMDSFKVDMELLGIDMSIIFTDKDNGADFYFIQGDANGAKFTYESDTESIDLFAYQNQSGEVNIYTKDDRINIWGKKPSELVDGIIKALE